MAIINQPANLFSTPFAQNGDKNIIPASGGDEAGKASLASGFPPVTQKPLKEGGVAPSRKDFNGVLNMLSAFAFFNQSGGMFTWSDSLNYSQPAIVFYQDKLYWCLQDSGIGTTAGAKTPDNNPTYWQNLINALADMIAGGSGGSNIFPDIGDIKMHYGTTAPSGWFALLGGTFSATQYPLLYAKLGTNILPNFSGRVPRAYDPTGAVDPHGASRAIGSLQTDAGKNASGYFGADDRVVSSGVGGSFYAESGYDSGSEGKGGAFRIYLDLSRSWGKEHTSTEFRMANFSILFCIKHD